MDYDLQLVIETTYMQFKNLKSSLIIGMIVSLLIMFNSSCVITKSPSSQAPRGWFKNTNNPHNPRSTNPGHNKDKKKKNNKHLKELFVFDSNSY